MNREFFNVDNIDDIINVINNVIIKVNYNNYDDIFTPFLISNAHFILGTHLFSFTLLMNFIFST